MWKKLAAGAVVAALAGSTIWYATRPDPAVLFAELIADLSARGEPISLAEMEAPMPPDEENGALDLDRAMDWWGANRPVDDWEDRVPGGWNGRFSGDSPWIDQATPEELVELERFLAYLTPLFEHLDTAAEKPEIAWPLLEIQGPKSAFLVSAEIPTIQKLVRFLDARAYGGTTPEERLRGIHGALAIGARFRARTLLDHMVAAVVHRHATQNLRDLLERARIAPGPARTEFDALLAEPFDARFSRMVRAERARILDFLPFSIDGSMQEYIERTYGGSPGTLAKMTATVERAVEGRLKETPPTLAEEIVALRELDRYLAPERAAIDVCSERRSITGSPTLGMAEMLPRIRVRLVGADSVARLARLALAAYEHRRLHGDWPTSAQDLAPLFPDGVPIDPYTGEAFVFEPDGEHLVLRATPWPWLLQNEDNPRSWGHVWRLPPR